MISTLTTTGPGTWTSKGPQSPQHKLEPCLHLVSTSVLVNLVKGGTISTFSSVTNLTIQTKFCEHILFIINVQFNTNSEVYYQLVNCGIRREFKNLLSVLENVKCFGSHARISKS